MLKNFKIGTRLAIGFGVVIAVFMAGLALILAQQVRTLEQAREIRDASLPLALRADRMLLDVTRVQHYLAEAAATHNRAGIAQAEAAARRLREDAAAFQAHLRSRGEAAQAARMQEVLAGFEAFVAAGEAMAEAYIVKGREAGNERMEDFDLQCDRLVAILETFRKAQVEDSFAEARQIVDAATLSLQVAAASCLAGLLAAAAVAWFITRAITAPVRAMRQAIRGIEASGDFGVRIPAGGRDEIAEMAASLNALLAAQHQAITEVSGVVQAIAAGRFDVRVQASLRGDLLAMKEAVNDSAASVQATMGALGAVMAALSAGDFSRRGDAAADASLRGGFRDAIDQARGAMASLSAMLGDVGRVMDGVSGGDLSGRVSVQGQGDLARLRDNLNASLQTLSGALSAIGRNTGQVASAANEFSTAVGQIADGAMQQKHAMGQVATAVRQTTHAVLDVSRNTEEASQSSRRALLVVQDGRRHIEAMVEVVNGIAANSDKINRITEVIGRIANKTNLLSLNASIEAARAGEQGKGFAVVADEVGKLALSSAESSQEISALVQQAHAEAARAVRTVREVAQGMAQIEQGAGEMDRVLARIAAAMEQQGSAVEEINANVANLDRIADNNASAAEEITETAMALSRAADSTRQEVGRFRAG